MSGPPEAAPLRSLIGASYAAGRTLSGGLDPGTELSGLDLEDCQVAGGLLERTSWRQCTFDTCTFTGVDLSMSRLVDVRFSDCVVRDSKARAVSWAGVRAGGLAQRSLWFERCRLDYGSFMGIDARGMRFLSCSLVDADFAEADCRDVEFVDCDLSGARFSGADLRAALFTGTRGLSVDVRESRTLGMRVDAGAALDLVAAMGIEIVDPATSSPPTAGVAGA
jgi:fluoroquinolone resistance protein